MKFLYPNVLWMMLLPVILLIFLIATNKTNLELIFDQDILKRLAVSNNGLSLNTRNSLLFTALLFMILAVSRPVILKKEEQIQQNLIPVVIALDVSKSMLSEDIYPNRLELAKNKIKIFLKNSKNTAIGILLFAKSSFILSPVTQDFHTLLYMIDNLNSGLNFDNGSNILGMLESANELLSDYESKNIILLSDGGNKNDLSQEIAYAKQNKIKVFVNAVATQNGAPIPTPQGYLTDKSGRIVTVKLNKNIKNLALQSGGGYIEYRIDNNDINAIITELLNRAKKEQMDIKKVKVYTELFYYPLALGIFFLLLATSSLPRLKKTAPFLLLFYFSPLYSGLLDFQALNNAKKAYETKNYKYASNQYKKVVHNSEGYYNLGNSLYKEGKYNEALESYQKVVTSDTNLEFQKLHNMGNSYVKLNNLPKAKQMYEKALTLQDDKQTKENLDIVNKALQEKKEQKEQKENKDKSNKQKGENKKQNSQNKKTKESQKDKNSQNKKEQKKDLQDKKQNKKGEDKGSKQAKNIEEEKNLKPQEKLSDLEEKKWLKKLQESKAPILLHKADTPHADEGGVNPW